jgi:hypothetical protein
MGCNNWGELQCVNMFEVCRVFPAGRCRGTREVTCIYSTYMELRL